MARRRKNAEEQLNIDLPRELVEAMRRFCDQNAISRKAIVELALRRLLNDHHLDAR